MASTDISKHKLLLLALYVAVVAVVAGTIMYDGSPAKAESSPVSGKGKAAKPDEPVSREVETRPDSQSSSEGPDPNKEGIALAQQGRLFDALPFFREAIRMQADRPDLWSNLGVTYMRLGIEAYEKHNKHDVALENLQEAIEAYSAALAIDATNAMCNDNLKICQNFIKDKFSNKCTYELCGAGFEKSKGGAKIDVALEEFSRGRVKKAVEILCSSRSDLTFKISKLGDLDGPNFKKIQAVFKVCGMLIIQGAVSQPLVERLRIAQEKQFNAYIERITANPGLTNTTETEQRSPGRYELKMPMEMPFLDEGLVNNKKIIPVVKSLIGTRFEIDTFSHVTSNPHTPLQHVHRDAGFLFPQLMGSKNYLPPHGIVCFIPLVRVEKRMGPTEFILGSHVNLEKDELHALPMMETPAKAGSAILFDVRIQHRGGANQTPNIRPVIYISYVREWWFDRVNFNDKQTKQLDSYKSLSMKKLLSRIDTRAYTNLLESKLQKDYGVDVDALQSTYNYTKHDLDVKS